MVPAMAPRSDWEKVLVAAARMRSATTRSRIAKIVRRVLGKTAKGVSRRIARRVSGRVTKRISLPPELAAPKFQDTAFFQTLPFQGTPRGGAWKRFVRRAGAMA